MPRFPLEIIETHQARLNAHPIYARVRRLQDLQIFMQHHVYSVWDFMSTIKYLQAHIAPTRYPWTPKGDPLVRRFINELVMEEESDQGIPDAEGRTDTLTPAFISHFELYCEAMCNIGADPRPAITFAETAGNQGIEVAFKDCPIPAPARAFTAQTFAFIDTDKPHVIAAAFALGREHIIPGMFRAFLDNIGLSEADAPAFHYYLNRHVHLDQDFHAPMSIRMLKFFIGDDESRLKEATDAALQAIDARMAFWDGVLDAIEMRDSANS